MHDLKKIAWEQFKALEIEERAKYYLQPENRPYHCLLAQQFDRKALEQICSLATMIRKTAKTKTGMTFLMHLLDHKRAMLDFSQPSSRTFLSFYSACQILGLQVSEVRDPSISSEIKGESREDTVRTFSSYFDMIIMRTPLQGFTEKMAWMLSNTERPIPLINAGSGKDQHPTQALLDIYTLERSFEEQGGIDGKTIVYCGDMARGRTVRSLSKLLAQYNNVKQIFVAPEHLVIGNDIIDQLTAAGVEYEVSTEFKKYIPQADAIYMTRLQDEWDTKPGESGSYDKSEYTFTGEDLKNLKKTAVIMHPLPRRQEISTDCDSDPRAVYWRQMRNGMWVRAALIATIFCQDRLITEYYLANVAK